MPPVLWVSPTRIWPQKAIQDECAARGIECKVEAQGGLGIENELTQEDVDPADLVLESVDVGVENEDRFEQKMAEGKFLKVGTSDVIADPVKIIDQAIEIIKATGGAVDAPKAEAKAEKKAVSAAPQAPTPASKQSIFADPGKTLLNAFNTGVSYFIPIVVIGGVFLAFSLASGTAGANGMEVTNPLMVSLNTIGMARHLHDDPGACGIHLLLDGRQARARPRFCPGLPGQ